MRPSLDSQRSNRPSECPESVRLDFPLQFCPFPRLKNDEGTVMRIGKPLEHAQAAVKALDVSDPVLKFTALGRQLGYAGYLFNDMLVWVRSHSFLLFSLPSLTLFFRSRHTRPKFDPWLCPNSQRFSDELPNYGSPESCSR